MTGQTETLPPRSLPFAEMAKTGVSALVHNPVPFLQMAVLPIILFSLSRLALKTYAPDAVDSLLAPVIDRVFTTVFGMAWLGFLLLPGNPKHWLPRWSREHTIYLLYLILIAALEWMDSHVTASIAAEWPTFYRSYRVVIVKMLGLPSGYVHAAIGLAFCNLTVKQPGGPLWSWQLMGWSAIKVVVIVLVAEFCLNFLVVFFIFLSVLFSVDHVTGYPATLLVALLQPFINYASYAISLGVLAFVYRELTGWIADRRELLERFE